MNQYYVNFAFLDKYQHHGCIFTGVGFTPIIKENLARNLRGLLPDKPQACRRHGQVGWVLILVVAKIFKFLAIVHQNSEIFGYFSYFYG